MIRPTFDSVTATAYALVLGLLAAPPTLATQGPELTVERIARQPSIIGTAPARLGWSPDSRRLAFLWNDRGLRARSVWLVERDGTAPSPLTPASADAGGGSVAEFAWEPTGRMLYYLANQELWRIAVGGGGAERLTSTEASKAELRISPNGRFASFRQEGDLWLFELEGGHLIQATDVGEPPIGEVPLGIYSRPDVEIGPDVWGGGAPTYAWSPDSRFIAVHYVDRRNVRTVPFPYYLGDETVPNKVRRGYPGDDNEIRTLGIYEISSGLLKLMDLPDPTSTRIAGFAWSPTGLLLIDRESDTAVDRWMHLFEPQAGSLQQVWHDHRATRAYNAISSSWHGDGEHILFVGDLDDRYRLYALRPGDAVPKALTGAGYDVTGPPISVRSTRSIFFVSNESSPYERHVFRMGDDGGIPRQLTTRPGLHTPLVSPDGSTIALLHTDDVTPTELYLVDARGGTAPRRITNSPPAEFRQHAWVTPKYVTFPSLIDDYTLHARILEPPGIDRSKQHPVVFGPVYSNTVRKRWRGIYSTLQQFLVLERGYIVVQLDLRGSTGYGREFREEYVMDWGGEDLEDLESAVEYLKTLPYVDPDRIGIWGSSYGGLLTVFSLLKKPGLFAAGVAGAPAVDPRFFGPDDVAISRRPQSHPEAFTRNAMQYAGNLRDHLLIIHGMQDDVVPFKTSVVLAEELMRLGKDFDFAFAPAATHGWTAQEHYAVYLLRKLVQHFDRYLGPEPRDTQAMP